MIVRLSVALCAIVSSLAFAEAPVSYRLTFPEPEHHWMNVEVTFPDLPPSALQIRMSRSSPGRYAVHEFAKNVFDVQVTDGAGKTLDPVQPNPHEWDVNGHDGTVRVAYKVFGDRIDGTYLAIDSTHAHINMPAALMWARGLDRRPVTVRFEPPPQRSWRVATQLLPGPDAQTFTAPNLQYLMDSPSEFSDFALRMFELDADGQRPVFRIAVHHKGSDADLDAFARDAEKIVREAKYVFGEYPRYENNTYTFIADYLPWAGGDGMEHRNSTFLTSPSSLESDRLDALSTVSHEFFHCWNVERIRPRALEPFNFEDANMSGELWFAEGFTSYYGPLVMHRAGLTTVDDYARELASGINTVTLSPGRQVRTAEEMSRFAPFVDNAVSVDRKNLENTFISYYTWGAAIGLGLDLTLRDRSDNRVTLDDFMRAMWQEFGKSGERVPGYVERPYTIADWTNVLASVSGDAAFASDFLARYIQGHDIVDYRRLLARAGFVMKAANPATPWIGDMDVQPSTRGLRVLRLVAVGTPAYEAGLDEDDLILTVAGHAAQPTDSLSTLLRGRKPGETVDITFERRGATVRSTLRITQDPRMEIVPAEAAGHALSDAERRFRTAWLGPRAAQLLKR